MTTQSKSLRLARLVQANRVPYEMHGILSDGALLCRACCKENEKLIATTTGDDGWTLVAADANWEDHNLYCCNCGHRIDPMYEL